MADLLVQPRNTKELRAYVLADYLLGRHNDLSETLFKQREQMYRSGTRTSLLTGLVTGTALALAYVFVAVRGLAGTIDLGFTAFNTVYASAGTPSITLDPGVVLKGRGVRATITAPITNKGTIVADQANPPGTGDVFNLTTAPITNLGTLAAVTQSILNVSTLAAPNTGTSAGTMPGVGQNSSRRYSLLSTSFKWRW